MTAGRVVRLVALAGLLGLASDCDLLLGIPDLGDPGNVASMKARFKAIIQAEADSLASLDWGVADDRIWRHHMEPRKRRVPRASGQRAHEAEALPGQFLPGHVRQHRADRDRDPGASARKPAKCLLLEGAFRFSVDRRGAGNRVAIAERHADADTAPIG